VGEVGQRSSSTKALLGLLGRGFACDRPTLSEIRLNLEHVHAVRVAAVTHGVGESVGDDVAGYVDALEPPRELVPHCSSFQASAH
jgi:hypothetical protein